MSESQTEPSDAADVDAESNPQTRRGLLYQGITAVFSFVLVTVPATLGGIFFLDPILRNRKKGKTDGEGFDGFIKLDLNREAVPADGTPVSVTVKSDLTDAWNRFRDVPVGSVWLRKNPDGQILVFNSVCPHLGCSVNYRRSENDFFCPCHTSRFELDGTKTNEVPPRDMDVLELKTGTSGAPDESGQELWIRYQNFRGGRAEKIPV